MQNITLFSIPPCLFLPRIGQDLPPPFLPANGLPGPVLLPTRPLSRHPELKTGRIGIFCTNDKPAKNTPMIEVDYFCGTFFRDVCKQISYLHISFVKSNIQVTLSVNPSYIRLSTPISSDSDSVNAF